MTQKVVGFSMGSSSLSGGDVEASLGHFSAPGDVCAAEVSSAEDRGAFFFASVPQALGWSAEVLRHRRFPKISSALRDGLAIEHRALGWALDQAAEADGRSYVAGIDYVLPSDRDDKMMLASRVWQWLSEALSADEALLLRLRFFGDYYDEGHLAKALREQEMFRAKGKRVALRYALTFRDMGALTGVDPKTAYRRLDKALGRAFEVLAARGVLVDWGVNRTAV